MPAPHVRALGAAGALLVIVAAALYAFDTRGTAHRASPDLVRRSRHHRHRDKARAAVVAEPSPPPPPRGLSTASALSWLEPLDVLKCGRWPNASRLVQHLAELGVDSAQRFGWSCSAFSRRLEMHRPRHERVTPASCARWCEAQVDPTDAIQGKWCCAWAEDGHGEGTCSWADGTAVVKDVGCQAPGRHSPSRGTAECVHPLAYEACSFAAGFERLDGFGCRDDSRTRSAHALDAGSFNACSQLCVAQSGCGYFAFSAAAARCGGAACKLYEACRATRRPLPGAWRTYRRTSMASAVWPTQAGAPLGMRVPSHSGSDEGASGAAEALARPGGGAAAGAGAEYACDTSDGKRMGDAMRMGGEWPNACSQICLPNAFWGPAQRRGVVGGSCKASGCGTFVAARKYAGGAARARAVGVRGPTRRARRCAAGEAGGRGGEKPTLRARRARRASPRPCGAWHRPPPPLANPRLAH